MTTERVAVLGATGPVGYSVICALMDHGAAVVAVSRNSEKLKTYYEDAGPSIEPVVADIAQRSDVLDELASTCASFVLAAGVDPGHLDQQVAMVRSVVEASPRRLVYVSSCWSYAPLVREMVDESHPRRGEGKVRYRAQAEDEVIDSGGTVLHLPDFYGPRVHTSPLQRVISLAMAGKRVTWPAGRTVVREHAYIGDVGEIIVRSIAAAPAGAHLVVPGSGPITFDEMLAHTAAALDGSPRGIALGWIPLPLLRLVDPWSRHLGDALREYRKPVRYDGTSLLSHIGSVQSTPYQQGIAATVDWIGQSGLLPV